MIILITGATHTGKTLLAQKLLEERKSPCFSIDHLKMGLIRSGMTPLTPEDDEELTDYLWPIVREMLKTAIENRQDLIVEGCYVPFGWRKDFSEEYLREIRFICLAMSDAYVDAHIGEIRAHASDIERRLFEADESEEFLKSENRRYAEGFRRSGEPVVLIGTDYEETIRKLVESLKEREPLQKE